MTPLVYYLKVVYSWGLICALILSLKNHPLLKIVKTHTEMVSKHQRKVRSLKRGQTSKEEIFYPTFRRKSDTSTFLIFPFNRP